MLGFGFCHRKPLKIYKTDKQLLAHEEEYPIKPLTPSFKYGLPLLWSLFRLLRFFFLLHFQFPINPRFYCSVTSSLLGPNIYASYLVFL